MSLVSSLRWMVQKIASRPASHWFSWVAIQIKVVLGFPAVLDSPDRKFLEQVMLPALSSRDDIERVLFVGCDWYSKHYKGFFKAKALYQTIDASPRQKRYGSSGHRTMLMQEIREAFPGESFDLIVCNGVFGYGLNDQDGLSDALSAAHHCLRDGGELLFGWNDVPERSPFNPLPLIEDQGFTPVPLPGFQQHLKVIDMPTRHNLRCLRMY